MSQQQVYKKAPLDLEVLLFIVIQSPSHTPSGLNSAIANKEYSGLIALAAVSVF